MQFDESKHPRADDGKFTDGNGTSKKAYDSRDTFGNLTRNLPEGARAAIDKATKELEREQRREIERGRVIEIDAATGEEKVPYNSKKIKQLPALHDRDSGIGQIMEQTGFSHKKAALAYDTVKYYTKAGYRKIRSNPDGEAARIVEEFIAAHPKHDGTIYRGLGFFRAKGEEFLNALIAKKENGQSIGMDGISSWSDEEEVAKKFASGRNVSEDSYRFVFVLDNETDVGVDHISDWAGESEVLQSGKSTYTVMEIKQVESGKSPLYKIFVKEKE